MGIKGLDTLADVVEVIANPKKYEEKITEIKKLVAQYTEAAEAVVALAAVNDYTQNIKKREEESKLLLEAAKADAKEIVANAKGKASKMEEANIARQVELNKIENDLSARQSKLEEEARNQTAEAAALIKWKEELDQRALKLTQDEAVLAEKQAKLKAALA